MPSTLIQYTQRPSHKKYTTSNKYILQMVRNSHSHTDCDLQMFGAIINPVIRIHTYITIEHTYKKLFGQFPNPGGTSEIALAL